MSLKTTIASENLPSHIAIIMDGNGRWAKEKGFMRIFGHENGTKSVRTTVESCAEPLLYFSSRGQKFSF